MGGQRPGAPSPGTPTLLPPLPGELPPWELLSLPQVSPPPVGGQDKGESGLGAMLSPDPGLTPPLTGHHGDP